MRGLSTSLLALTLGTIRPLVTLCGVCEAERKIMFEVASIYEVYRACVINKCNMLNAIYFVAHSLKMREIFEANFRERVVHHLLAKMIKLFYKCQFIFDVYNNRKGKGVQSMSKRVQQ